MYCSAPDDERPDDFGSDTDDGVLVEEDRIITSLQDAALNSDDVSEWKQISLQQANAALPEGSRADKNETKKNQYKEWADQRQNKERNQISRLLDNRRQAGTDGPRSSGGEDAPPGVGSSEGPGSSSPPVSSGTKLHPVDDLLLPANANIGTARAVQDGIDVTEIIFATAAPCFCYRDGEFDYHDIKREYAKDAWQVSFQEFDTDNATVKQHGEDVLRGLKRHGGKYADLAITDSGNRAGIDKFYEAYPFILSRLEATVRNSIQKPGLDWYVHEVCHTRLRNFYWLMHHGQFYKCEPRPERLYKGIDNSVSSGHCILIRQYIAKLSAWVAEIAGIAITTIGHFEHFIPWITPMDALCIESLNWYYDNYASIIIKPTSHDTALWHLANVRIERHPFGTCMTLGHPMIYKIKQASPATAFLTSGSDIVNMSTPSEFRHDYPSQKINGWHPNGQVPWIGQAPLLGIGTGVHPLCDALITHLTDFGAIGIDLDTGEPVHICDCGNAKLKIVQSLKVG